METGFGVYKTNKRYQAILLIWRRLCNLLRGTIKHGAQILHSR